jgi:hypothetical protein
MLPAKQGLIKDLKSYTFLNPNVALDLLLRAVKRCKYWHLLEKPFSP